MDEDVIALHATNPGGHARRKVDYSSAHGPNCGHEQVPLGDHVVETGFAIRTAIIAMITGPCS